MTTTPSQSLSVAKLRAAADAILGSLEERDIEEIAVDVDYFWSISPEQQYDVTAEPTEFTIGQVSESYGQLTRIVGSGEQPVDYTLVWLGEVLQAAGFALTR
jgi:hypothetical protein